MSQPQTLFPWIGNKKNLIPFILNNMPSLWNKETNKYIDPFLGSGVVLYHVNPRNAVVGDFHQYIIYIFKCLKAKPKRLWEELMTLVETNRKDKYDIVKNTIVSIDDTCIKAAMFWYLVKTSLYSFVSPKSDGSGFTACYRPRRNIQINKTLFFDFHNVLKTNQVIILHADFDSVLGHAQKGDFVFLDPPYISEKTPYRKIHASFKKGDLVRLLAIIKELDEKGCYVMLFYHDYAVIKNALPNFTMKLAPVVTSVRPSKFKNYQEAMFVNY